MYFGFVLLESVRDFDVPPGSVLEQRKRLTPQQLNYSDLISSYLINMSYDKL